MNIISSCRTRYPSSLAPAKSTSHVIYMANQSLGLFVPLFVFVFSAPHCRDWNTVVPPGKGLTSASGLYPGNPHRWKSESSRFPLGWGGGGRLYISHQCAPCQPLHHPCSARVAFLKQGYPPKALSFCGYSLAPGTRTKGGYRKRACPSLGPLESLRSISPRHANVLAFSGT
jgi:hypothetical protein